MPTGIYILDIGVSFWGTFFKSEGQKLAFCSSGVGIG